MEVEKAFHPFITGLYNCLMDKMMQQMGMHISIPPPGVSLTEIVFMGEKD